MDVSEAIIGIDLGTTNSAVGVVDSGFPVLIPNGEGDRLLPSVVALRGEGLLVGAVAKRGRAAHPAETVSSVKRFMGRPFADLKAEELEVSYGVRAGEDGGIELCLAERRMSPVEISCEVLKALKEQAEGYLGVSVKRAVITVPAYFNDSQRMATKEAGERAGLVVERIINEPTAAALAYGIDRQVRSGKVAVFDLGGGTFDISILELRDSVFRVLATNGNTRLGGDDIDRALSRFLKEEIERDLKGKLSGEEWARVSEEAELAKCRLSEVEKTVVELPFLREGYSFRYELERRELDRLARPIVERTREHCLRSLRDAKLEAGDLDRVILVGGQTRMPLVRAVVKEIFGREPDVSVNPDEAVAVGASIQGGILSGAMQHMVLLDVTPLSLGIETFGGLMNVIIPRNSTIPTKAGELFTNAVDGQQSMKVQVLQGERELAKDNWRLGALEIEFEPGARGTARVGVQFEIDANGILRVLVRDTKSGAERVVRLESAVDVADEEVERMVSESVEYAFEDMRERQWIETELKAEKAVAATRQALAMLKDEVEEGTRREVEAAMKVIEEARQGGQGKDVAALKEKISQLDAATRPLAERLIEKAMG